MSHHSTNVYDIKTINDKLKIVGRVERRAGVAATQWPAAGMDGHVQAPAKQEVSSAFTPAFTLVPFVGGRARSSLIIIPIGYRPKTINAAF